MKAKIDIFELDYVIFPMNIGETHWAMGAIDLKDKGFRYFDSMFCTSATSPHGLDFCRLLTHLENVAWVSVLQGC